MNDPKTKLAIPRRASASIAFGLVSLFTLRVYAEIMWNTRPKSDQASEIIVSLLISLETTRSVLAVVALLFCIWSWHKERWVPSVAATLFTALVLYVAFFIDS